MKDSPQGSACLSPSGSLLLPSLTVLWAVWICTPQKHTALTLISLLFGWGFLGEAEVGREMYVEEWWEHAEAAVLGKMFSATPMCLVLENHIELLLELRRGSIFASQLF